MSTDYLERVLQQLGEEDAEVVTHGPSSDGLEYTVVLNKGIKGSPEYRVPLKGLPKLEAATTKAIAKAKAEAEEKDAADWKAKWTKPELDDEPEPEDDPTVGVEDAPHSPIAAPAVDYAVLSYRELQSLAKDRDIPGNQSAEELVAALEEKDSE